MSPVCVCGHLDIPTHLEGPCRMAGCDCGGFQSEDEIEEVERGE